MQKPPSTKLIRKAMLFAHEQFASEGQLEIDSDYPDSRLPDAISACDEWKEEGGFYVKAWVWVSLDDLKNAGKQNAALT